MRKCLTCGGSLAGSRKDAIYCGTPCRMAGYRARRDARIRHEAMRELARALDPSGEILDALDDLEGTVPNFALLNAKAIDAGLSGESGQECDG